MSKLSRLFHHIKLYPFEDSRPIVKQGCIIDVSPELATVLRTRKSVRSFDAGPEEGQYEFYRPMRDRGFDAIMDEVIRLSHEAIYDTATRILENRQGLDALFRVLELVIRDWCFCGPKETIRKRIIRYTRKPNNHELIASVLESFLNVQPFFNKTGLVVVGPSAYVDVTKEILPYLMGCPKRTLTQIYNRMSEGKRLILTEKGICNVA